MVSSLLPHPTAAVFSGLGQAALCFSLDDPNARAGIKMPSNDGNNERLGNSSTPGVPPLAHFLAQKAQWLLGVYHVMVLTLNRIFLTFVLAFIYHKDCVFFSLALPHDAQQVDIERI